VEDCSFVNSQAPVSFVGIQGVVFRHNAIYCPTGWALRILQENNSSGFVPCQNGRFEDNVVVWRESQIKAGLVNVGSRTAPETFAFQGNFWYCLDRPSRCQPA